MNNKKAGYRAKRFAFGDKNYHNNEYYMPNRLG